MRMHKSARSQVHMYAFGSPTPMSSDVITGAEPNLHRKYMELPHPRLAVMRFINFHRSGCLDSSVSVLK